MILEKLSISQKRKKSWKQLNVITDTMEKLLSKAAFPV